jgi:hypothetical protein
MKCERDGAHSCYGPARPVAFKRRSLRHCADDVDGRVRQVALERFGTVGEPSDRPSAWDHLAAQPG